MLKNNNYLDKRTGLTLPVVALAEVDTIMGSAVFKIGTSREEIMKGNIIEKVKMSIDFNKDRTKSPREVAYEFAKTQRKEKHWNEKKEIMEEVLVNPPFYGWVDEK
jgi:predicted HTH transcriptional regulator